MEHPAGESDDDLCGLILIGDCIWNFTAAASPPMLDCSRIANSTTLSACPIYQVAFFQTVVGARTPGIY